jgi:hypothetical protein
MDLYSLPIYDDYFNYDYFDHDIINNDSNNNDDIIDSVLVDNIKIECKENTKGAQQKKIVNLNYVILLIARLMLL